MAEKVMVKWETPHLVNNGLVVKENVPEKILQQVGDIIFHLQDTPEGQTILSSMELSHYEPATNTTYQPVETFLAEFEKDVRPIRLQP